VRSESDGRGDLDRDAAETRKSTSLLFLASFLGLYFELVIIRYLSSDIRIFAYLKNLPLIACFFGIGLGMIIGKPPAKLRQFFPLIAAAIFLLIAFASPLKLTHVALPAFDLVFFGGTPSLLEGRRSIYVQFLTILQYVAIVPGIMYLIVGFFMVLGGTVGQFLSAEKPLRGYGVNLAGSLVGILVFTALSFSGFSPAIWVLIGFLAALPFFMRDRVTLAVFALIVGVVAVAQGNAYWSPYYRIKGVAAVWLDLGRECRGHHRFSLYGSTCKHSDCTSDHLPQIGLYLCLWCSLRRDVSAVQHSERAQRHGKNHRSCDFGRASSIFFGVSVFA
jgi:hypothetical protein